MKFHYVLSNKFCLINENLSIRIHALIHIGNSLVDKHSLKEFTILYIVPCRNLCYLEIVVERRSDEIF